MGRKGKGRGKRGVGERREGKKGRRGKGEGRKRGREEKGKGRGRVAPWLLGGGVDAPGGNLPTSRNIL